jgi:hypothetical protein
MTATKGDILETIETLSKRLLIILTLKAKTIPAMTLCPDL